MVISDHSTPKTVPSVPTSQFHTCPGGLWHECLSKVKSKDGRRLETVWDMLGHEVDINVDFPNGLDVLFLHAKVLKSTYKVYKVKRR